VVRRILVEDGQAVRAGQVLIELDATAATADVERVNEDLVTYRLQEARGQAMLDALKSGHIALAKVRGADGRRLAEAARLVEGQYAEFRARNASLDAEIAKRQAELRSIHALVAKLEQTVPIARQRAADYKEMVEANFVSRHGYLEREQQRIEQEGDLANLRSRSGEVVASLNESQTQKAALHAETRRVALDLINDAQQRLSVLAQDRIKAETHERFLRLESPVDGVVQQLAVHTVGGVVTPAQPLMVVVPQEHAMEVEAVLENKDVGFVTAGQAGEVKVAAFEYTKYGTIPSTVTHVSRDAVNDEKVGLVYTMRVKMERPSILVHGKEVNLSPGMAVTVEVKTGRRRVIEYFLSPLLQHADESLGER
jgi:hemolysin D